MTEREFYLTCLGFKRKRLNEARSLRRTHWLILNSFADPKKLPSNEQKWLPLEGEEVEAYTAPDKDTLQSWVKQFRELGTKHEKLIN